MFHDDVFEEVGHVLTAVGGVLEQVEDLLPLHDRDRIALFVEELSDGFLMNAVGFVLETVDLDGAFEDAAVFLERHRPRRGPRSAEAEMILASSRAPKRTRSMLYSGTRRGGVVDRIHHVVERAGQRVDVFAVDRRHERLVQPLNDLVREEVALVLDFLDLVRFVGDGGSVANISSSSRAPTLSWSAMAMKSA